MKTAGEKKMKLYELRLAEELSEDGHPWRPWYDKAFGFVVRAETPERARQIAALLRGDTAERDRLCELAEFGFDDKSVVPANKSIFETKGESH